MCPQPILYIHQNQKPLVTTMISPWRLFLANFLISYLPTTRFFLLKRELLRWAGVKAGKNIRICSNVRIYGNGELSIGDNTWIGHETLIICSEKIQIGANVDIAPRCYIGTGTHKIDIQSPNVAGAGLSIPITIGDGAWLCTHCTILPGAIIGNKSIVAAGAVVKGKIPPLEMWGGIPAKKLKELCPPK